MTQSGFKWVKTPETAFDELYNAYTNTLFTVGGRVVSSYANRMEIWAKQNAPWTDRTGMARAGLRAIPEQNPGIVGEIFLTHSVPYGIWLEISYGGRWAIISKAVDYWGPIVWRGIQGMMNLGLISK